MKTLAAYDYDAQRWIEGEEARLLLIKQVGEEIALIQTPGKGAEYASVMGFDRKEREKELYEELLILSSPIN